MTRMSDNRSSLLRTAALATGLIAVATLASSTPAQAHEREHRHHGHAPYHSYRVVPRGTFFVVPPRIHARYAYRYDPYLVGPVYYRPHRHHRLLYRFPVRTAVGVVFEPYSYCDDGLFVNGYVSLGGPRFHVSAGF